jgi:hypothetical protein
VGARVTARLVAAVALAGLAVVAILLAADARSWEAALSGGDAVYAASASRATWTPGTSLGGVAGDVLATEDDVAVRRALRLYRVAAATHLRLDNATEVQTARARAQDALLRVAAGSDPERSAQARTLLGILTFGSSASGGEEDQVEGAISDFTDAIRADGANDDAKFDLELLLRLSAAHGTRPGEGVGGGFGRGGRRGAGGGSPGRGY